MLFKLVSANIRFDNPNDAPHDWSGRREILSSFLNNFETDLLGTQEGRQPQLRDLESLLSNLQIADNHRDWIEERMYPCIFFNPEKIEVYESGDIWLSETPYVAGTKSFDSAFPRLCTWIKAKFKSNNFEFFYVNTHLDHVLSDTRAKQIEVLLNETSKVNKDNFPMLLTGDFNESPFESVRSNINSLKPELVDPWMKQEKAEFSSHHRFNGSTDEGTRIDWILIDKSIQCNSINFLMDNVNGIYPSDHYPLLGEFSI